MLRWIYFYIHIGESERGREWLPHVEELRGIVRIDEAREHLEYPHIRLSRTALCIRYGWEAPIGRGRSYLVPGKPPLWVVPPAMSNDTWPEELLGPQQGPPDGSSYLDHVTRYELTNYMWTKIFEELEQLIERLGNPGITVGVDTDGTSEWGENAEQDANAFKAALRSFMDRMLAKHEQLQFLASFRPVD